MEKPLRNYKMWNAGRTSGDHYAVGNRQSANGLSTQYVIRPNFRLRLEHDLRSSACDWSAIGNRWSGKDLATQVCVPFNLSIAIDRPNKFLPRDPVDPRASAAVGVIHIYVLFVLNVPLAELLPYQQDTASTYLSDSDSDWHISGGDHLSTNSKLKKTTTWFCSFWLLRPLRPKRLFFNSVGSSVEKI